MGPTQVGLLILGGVALLAIFAFIAQNLENTKREKHLRVMALKDSIRKAEYLLTSYPKVFMSIEIKKLLGKYIEQKWQMICELHDTKDHQEQFQKAQTIKMDPVEPVPHQPGSLTLFPDPMTARRSQGILEEFSRFLAEAEKNNEINAAIKKGYLKQLQLAHSRTRHDIDIFEGLQIEQMTGSIAALPKLRHSFNSLETLSKQHNLQTMDRQIYELRTYVDNIIAMKQQSEEERIQKLKKEAEDEVKKNQFL